VAIVIKPTIKMASVRLCRILRRLMDRGGRVLSGWRPHLPWVTSGRRRRYIFTHEETRLEKARQLGDREMLLDLARSAVQPAIRLQAARLCGDFSALTAIALKEWDIHRGVDATQAVHNSLLLRRIARSARQDAIRTEAAIRLNDDRVLRETARSIQDIKSRWRIARHLNDPLLMAAIARFKPANERFQTLRSQAHSCTLDALDASAIRHDFPYLQYFIYRVPDIRYKIEAFLRMPSQEVDNSLLNFLALQDYRFAPVALLEGLFDRIQAAGWAAHRSHADESCTHCRGNGQLRIKCAAEEHADPAQDLLPCPECRGRGRIAYRVVIFSRDAQKTIIFRIPDGRLGLM
jgi:hypothetical protein